MNKWLLKWGMAISLVFLSGIIQGQESESIPGQLILLLQPDAQISDLTQRPIFYNQKRIRISHTQTLIDQINLHLFSFDHTQISPQIMLENIRKIPAVQIAQFNHKVDWRNTQTTFPNDPGFTNQWGLDNTGQFGGIPDADIDAPEAWDIAKGGLSVLGDTLVAAIVDGGLSPHQDLPLWKNHLEIPQNGIDDDLNGYIDDVDGWDAFNNDGTIPSDVHGTLVAGIVSAKTDNNQGIAGVNWNTKIMPVAGSSVNEAVVAIAYGYVLKMRTLYNETNGTEGAFVVVTNSSFGVNQANPLNFPIWCALYDSLGEQGILSVVSTMNINLDVDIVGDMPSACTSPWMIAVTNTTNIDQKRDNAAFGLTHIDLGAPGTQIYSTITSNNYGYDTGTSFASPFVAGAISVMYSAACPGFMIYYKNDPANAALKVRDFLFQSVDTLTDLQGITATGGRLNLHKSLITLLDSCSTFSNGCLPPYNLTVSHSTDSSVQLNWTVADSSAELFRIQYKKPADPTWQHLIVPADTFYILTGLEECTDYEFQVESICDSIFGTASGFFATMPFQTEGCCSPPKNLFATAISNSQFTANWNPIFGAQSYILSYQELGATVWNDTTVTDTFFQINSVLPCADYQFRVKAICNNLDNGFSDTALVRTMGCGACLDLTYCESSGEDVNFEWIDQVSIGPLFNQSGKNSGYGNFTSNTVQFVIDSLYQINLTPGYSGFAFSEAWRIWIDLNQDGLFNDSLEQVFGTSTAQNGPVNGQFSIPMGTLTGNTRMRVSMRFGGFSGNTVPAPCETFTEGEVEDYCIEITSETGPICPMPSNLNFVYTNQADSIIVKWDTVENSNGNYEIRIKNLVDGTLNQFQVLGDSSAIIGLNSCTKYEVSIRSICGNFFSSFSNPKLLLTKGCGACLDENYCIPLEASTINGWLREVEIGKISHISGDDNGYALFDNIPFFFNRGNTYSFTLTSSTDQEDFFYAIYADWNQDGIFDSPNEEVYNSQISFLDSVSGSFSMSNPPPLGISRLRIIMSSDSIKNACDTVFKGEIQDYCIEVLAGDANEMLLEEPNISIYPNPASSEFFIESEKLITSIRLISIQGQVILTQPLTSATNATIPLSKLSSGVYFVEINLGKRRVLRKVLVEKR